MNVSKIPPKVILFLITFWVSFILTLIVHKNQWIGFSVGVISIPTVALATWGMDYYHRRQNQIVYDELANEIDYLEEQEAEIYESLRSANLLQQEMESRIQNLDREKVYLLDYIGQLNLEKRKISDEVHSLQLKEKYHKDHYSSKNEEMIYLESQQEELTFKLELLELTVEKKEKKLNEINNYIDEFNRSQQTLAQQRNQLIQQAQEVESYYQQLVTSVEQIQQQRQELERQYSNEKREIENFKVTIKAQAQEQKNYNDTLIQLEAQKQQLTAQVNQLHQESQELMDSIQQQKAEIANFKRPHIRFKFFPQEWDEWLNFFEQLNPQEAQVFKAILKEDGETIKKLADAQATMPQVLVETLNQKALSLMGDTPFTLENSQLIPRIQDEYLAIFQELLVIKFVDTLPDDK